MQQSASFVMSYKLHIFVDSNIETVRILFCYIVDDGISAKILTLMKESYYD